MSTGPALESVLMAYRDRENFNPAWRMLSNIFMTTTNSTYFESHMFKLRYMMYIIDSWRWHYTWTRLLSMTEQGRSQWEKTLHIYVTSSSLIGWDVAPPWKETGPLLLLIYLFNLTLCQPGYTIHRIKIPMFHDDYTFAQMWYIVVHQSFIQSNA